MCHSDGVLAVNKLASDEPALLAISYEGYSRKYKMWRVAVPEGSDIFVDRHATQQFPHHTVITTPQQWKEHIGDS